MKPKFRIKTPTITADQKTQLINILAKIIGESISGKVGRALAAGAFATAASYMDVVVPVLAPANPPAITAPVSPKAESNSASSKSSTTAP